MALQCWHLDSLSPNEREHVSTLSEKDAYTWIKAKRQQVKQLLGGLDAIYNFYAPVNRLPIEIFLEIIHHVKARDAKRNFPWLKLAGVCRKWREILLATPILWTTINISYHPSFVQLCLKRSRKALISIHDGRPLSEATDVWVEALSPHMDRVRSLVVNHLNSSLIELMELILSTLTATMPHLERLELVTPQRAVLQRFSPSPGQFPRLRLLTLHNVFVPWSSSMLVGLSKLDLSFPTMRVPALPLETLLGILEASPRLTLLCMDDCALTIPAGNTSAMSPPRVVRLPELKKLKLVEHLLPLSCLLTHLVLPVDVFIHLCPHYRGNGNAQLAHPILDIFPHKLPNLVDVTRAELLVMDSDFSFEARTNAGTMRLHIELDYADFDYQEDLFAPAMCDIATLLASSPLRRVDFSGHQDYVEDRHWHETLGCLAGVEKLEVGMYGDVRSFWRVFGSSLDNGDLYCPCLKTLDMGDIELDEEMAGLVIERLQNRMLHGHRLKRLNYCYDKELPYELRHIVEMLVDPFGH